MKRIGWTLCIALLFAFPLSAQKVKVGYDKTNDFSKYKTYKFGIGLPVPNEKYNQVIFANMEQSLTALGLTKVDGATTPDIEVSYYGGLGTPLSVPPRSEFYPPAWLGYWGVALAGQFSAASGVVTGELQFEVRDLNSGHLVWQAYVKQNILDSNLQDSNKLGETIHKMVDKSFDKYPSKK
ncbi:MAG: DUF4136 domain-containing protein [Terriglobia bacterium]